MTRSTFWDINVFFYSRNLTEIEAITGCTFACICNTVFRMFSCLQINCQPFYLRQLLKFHQFDWLIEIYLQTEGQGAHHKMVSLQPMSGFSQLLLWVGPLLYCARFLRRLAEPEEFNKGEKPAIGQFLRGSLPWLTNDRDTKREKMTSVCFGLPWSEKCKQNHAWFWTEWGYKLKTKKCEPFRGRKIWNSEQW